VRRLARIAVLTCLAVTAAHSIVAAQAPPPRYAGRPLVDVLEDLRRQGLPLVYSSELVTPNLRVAAEPSAKDRRAILEELLAVHGLAVQAGPRNTLLIVAVKPRVQLPDATHAPAAPPPRVTPPVHSAETLPELLAVTAAYLQTFVQRFTNVVATEHYVQEQMGGVRRKHALTSDFFLITLPGSADWIECRDIYEADGKPVGDREKRLLKLLQDGSPKDWSARAASVARESTRYNLSDIGTINRPLVTLALMQAPYQPRLTFTSDGADAKAGFGVRVIAFREKAGGVFAQSPLWGRVWVDASTGMILKTELLFGNPRSPNQIVTTFEVDPLLGVAVPIDMTERYPRGDIRGHATYGQFRKFAVTSTETFGQ
jgi:hypothetical protein